MLKIQIKTGESYNEKTKEFYTTGPTVSLEHSLLSLSKWEAKYEKPFLTSIEEATTDEFLDYVRMMIVSSEYHGDVVTLFSAQNLQELTEYINNKKHTATWFTDLSKKKPEKSTETVTSELVYYWMFSYRIPIECETWNFNRLLTLIRIFNEKNKKPEKMSKSDIIARNRELNAARKAKLKTKG